MNSPFIVEQSRQFSTRLLSAGELSESARVALAFRLALNREPTASESEQAVDFVKQSQAAMSKVEKDPGRAVVRAWATFCQALFASAEFRYVD